MNTKPTFVYSIRGKLISAIAMLLVAVIMVVSSTYAWFTLSTAPEVTGISTAIGANGALEIRLNTTNKDDVNGTFGNIVALGPDGEIKYGLDQITLLPSQLLFTDSSNTQLKSNFLGFPTYGDDGRPGAIEKDKAQLGTFSNDGVFYPSENGVSSGVYAVGVASGMTDRQLAFRNAKNEADTNMGLAKSRARSSLSAHGNNLGAIIMTKATNSSATYSQTELGYLKAIINDLLLDAEEKGSLYYIKASYEQQILALVASQATNVLFGYDEEKSAEENAAALAKADLAFAYVKANIGTGDLTLANISVNNGIAYSIEIPATEEGGTPETLTGQVALPAGIKAGIDAYVKTYNNVVAAKNTADALTATELQWTDLSSVLNYILDYSKMTVNGFAPNEVMANATEIAKQGSVNLQMMPGSGVYADIADQCGNYSAGINVDLTYGGATMEDFPASMTTMVTEGTAPLIETAIEAAEAGGNPQGTGTQKLPMSEFYGYILDLVFQTNAAGSNLLLQTEAIDRIYNGNQNENTQGGGSSMSFKATDVTFTDDQVKELMSHIRIVFYDTEGLTVIAYAKLDTANAKVEADGSITANMYLYKTVTSYMATYVEADAQEDPTTGQPKVTTVKNLFAKEENIYTYYTESEYTTEYTIPSGATVEVGEDGVICTVKFTDETPDKTVYRKTEIATSYYTDSDFKTPFTYPAGATFNGYFEDGTTDVFLDGDDAIIKALPQNEEVMISTLVYLDGKTLENKHVAATAATSVTGSMNIQFSSSADLKPMEYGDLHITGETTPAPVTPSEPEQGEG